MDKRWNSYLTFVMPFLMQIHSASATAGCSITSISSPSAPTLQVAWDAYPGAGASYRLKLRAVNSTDTAPVMVVPTGTQTLVQGLRPGSYYDVTLKALQYNMERCRVTQRALTVPAATQITTSEALASTSIRFQWSAVTGADRYFLILELYILSQGLAPTRTQVYNGSFASVTGQVDGLNASTRYNCFVISYNSAGSGAPSRSRIVSTPFQPPTGVIVTSTGRSTATVAWDAVDMVLRYRLTVSDDDDGSVAPFSRDTDSTSMDITDLGPCSNYTVGVASVNNFRIAGEAANVSHTTATIKRVSTVQTDYSCANGMATVTWGLVFGANSYRATASDRNGTGLSCNSSSTTCQISNLRCGTQYEVLVTAISDDCESISNTSGLFETVPCAPVGRKIYRECNSNAIIFSWQPTNNTLYYVATSTDSSNKRVFCRTTETSCFFTNSDCGQRYHFTVYAISTCDSEVSPPEFVDTSPCLPTSVRTTLNCETQLLSATWDRVAGAQDYMVEAMGNNGDQYNCSSSNNSCALASLPCGEHLSVWITASNEECSTNRVLGEAAETVPCSPTNVSAVVGCSPDSARVNWTASGGAVFYIATAKHGDGSQHSCTSYGTNCLIERLTCGQDYNVSLTATNFKCNSSISAEFAITTAPCPPQSVQATIKCEANTALIKWQHSQSTGNFMALLEDQKGQEHRLNCTSNTVNSCQISALPCGRMYNITVTYDDERCPMTSTAISMASVLCSPTNVTATQSCGQTSVPVSWLASLGAVNYTAFAVSSTGQRTECSATGTSCIIQGSLHCGQVYTIAVVAVNDNCTSQESQSISLYTALCSPTNLSGEVTSGSHIPMAVQVTWDMSPVYGAIYTLRSEVVEVPGSNSTYNTTHTNFTLAGLQCGQKHSIRVKAEDGNCTSAESPAIEVATAPCMPANLTARVDCGTSMGNFSWSETHGVDFYTVEVMGDDGHMDSCTSTHTSCVVRLHCGCSYAASLVVSAGGSNSSKHAAINFDSGPCMPMAVVTNSDCNSSIGLVSWTASNINQTYLAVATGLDGHNHECVTNTSSCTWDDLHCGEEYTVQVMARNGNCTSLPSNGHIIHMGPCMLQAVVTNSECNSSIGSVSWTASSMNETYIAVATGLDGHTHKCFTNTSSCTWDDLHCGEKYTVHVMARNGNLTGLPSKGSPIHTGPCMPQAVVTNSECNSSIGLVSWTASNINQTYLAVATGLDGHNHECVTNTSSCTWDDLHCGEEYTVQVMARNGNCTSLPSNGPNIHMGPCMLQAVVTNSECNSSIGSVSWTASSMNETYIAVATGLDGHTHECFTNTSSCTWDDLHCGEKYTVHVMVRNGNLTGLPSNGSPIHTGPCMPQAVVTNSECNSSIASVSWTANNLNQTYIAVATGLDGHNHECVTNTSSCTWDDLHCGEKYTVHVMARNGNCTGLPSNGSPIHTGPCMPQAVVTNSECNSSIASVSWTANNLNQTYIAVATGLDGHNHECVTNTSSCTWDDLHCGEKYTVHVMARNGNCTGLPSNGSPIHTGACRPMAVVTNSECNSSIGLVSWTASNINQTYLAVATGLDGHNHECVTNTSSCTWDDLHCGEEYTVQVMARNGNCTSLPSNGPIIHMGPCMLQAVVTNSECNSSIGSVSWTASSMNETYIAVATGLDGHTHKCFTNTSSCTWDDLHCGEKYTVHVMARNGNLTGQPSNGSPIHTGPCMPQAVVTNSECNSSIGLVSWTASNINQTYLAVATGLDGHNHECVTNTSSCTWDDLHCGEEYTVQVMARNGNCTSLPSNGPIIHMGPCMLQAVVTNSECNSSIGSVSWTASSMNETYIAVATGVDGHTHECFTNTSSCTWDDLHCGEKYTVHVMARNGNLTGLPSNGSPIHTGPCMPQAVVTNSECNSSIASVSWTANNLNQTYIAVATGLDGHNHECVTNTSSCTWDDLHCGEKYTVHVMARNGNCTGLPSNGSPIHTGPCMPIAVVTNSDCNSSIGLVSWTASNINQTYIAVATGLDGHNHECVTNTSSCTWDDLHCGEKYTVHVMARNGNLTGLPSNGSPIHTGPCMPMAVVTNSDCNSSIGLVSWTASNINQTYLAVATGLDGHNHECVTNTSSCTWDDLHCGEEYTVQVMARNGNCTSLPSNGPIIHMGPCMLQAVVNNSECNSSIGSVSWTASSMNETYIAVATGLDGHTHECFTNTSSCTWDDLHCGEKYTVHVMARNGNCTGLPSNGSPIHTGPCMPMAVVTNSECNSSIGLVSWTASNINQTYLAVATGLDGHNHECVTNTSSCTWDDLHCGEEYTVQVMARNGNCTSLPSNGPIIHMGPCMLQAVVTNSECNSSIGSVSWTASSMNETYIAVATGLDGHTHECFTNTSSCTWDDLHCGEKYTVHVMARNGNCTGLPSNGSPIHTGPCMPMAVVTNSECNSSIGLVSWTASNINQTYLAVATGLDGHNHECVTNTSSCTWDDLHCGEEYTVQVMARNGNCTSLPSNGPIIHMGPCMLQAVVTNSECNSSIGSVSWTASSMNETYIAVATGLDGHTHECFTNTSSCTWDDLHCGEKYTVHVMARNGNCTGLPSNGSPIHTGPCMPMAVVTNSECNSSIGLVSWTASNINQTYLAVATGLDGHNHECVTNTSSCTWDDLHCGEEYTVQVMARNGNCTSLPSNGPIIHMGPCMLQAVVTNSECNSSIGSVSWTASSMNETYIAVATGLDGHTHECFTNTSSCTWDDLHCGEKYTVHVMARNGNLTGLPSNGSPIHTGPCMPQAVVTNSECNSSIASVSWTANNLNQTYIAVATGLDGHNHECVTNTSSCTWDDLHCGEKYTVHVMARNGNCTSLPSNGSPIHTGPCMPMAVVTNSDCNSSIGLVSWTASNINQTYLAVATGLDGHNHECVTNTSSCTWDDLHCGEEYTVQVMARNGNCTSLPSNGPIIHMGPCMLQAVVTNSECNSSIGSVSWTACSMNETYIAVATGLDGHTHECFTNTSSCTWDDLHCGEKYTVHVMARNGNCTGLPSNGSPIHTGPCMPMAVVTNSDCNSSIGLVSWTASNINQTYLAVATGLDGHNHECVTNTSSCTWDDLHCGEEYTVQVMARNGNCTSLPSNGPIIHMGPCMLQAVVTNSECNSSIGSVSWTASSMNETYIAVATGLDGHTHECFTNTSSCTWDDLHCGEKYTVHVMARNGNLTGLPSKGSPIHTGPCMPQAVVTNSVCNSSIASVSWTANNLNQTYIAVATALDGHNHECVTNTSSCTWDDLHCGEKYTVHVMARNGNCTGLPSNGSPIHTGPCMPMAVVTNSDCNSSIGLVSWTASNINQTYLAVATGLDGHNHECVTNTSSCTWDDLHCGEEYTVQVMARNGNCTSLPSNGPIIHMGPCMLLAVVTNSECNSSIGSVSWTASRMNETYIAVATGLEGHTHECFTNTSSCTWDDLHCGEKYTVHVMARNGNLTGLPSNGSPIHTGPCMPQAVVTNSECNSSIASVSWTANNLNQTYIAVATGLDGHNHECVTNTSSCTWDDLHCGEEYTVHVMARNGNCTGLPSNGSPIHTGPCMPMSVVTNSDCNSSIGLVSWTASNINQTYLAVATGLDGHNHECVTNTSSCTWDNLHCGEEYTVQVMARNGNCTSLPSSSSVIHMAPCPPQSISGTLDCVTNSAWISWNSSQGAASYTVMSLVDGDHRFNCTTSTNSTCEVQDLECGAMYNFSVIASNSFCDSMPSTPIELETAPCSLSAITAFVQCHNSSILVVWETMAGGEGNTQYNATAEASDRTYLYCNSTDTHCTLWGARCDLRYTIIVAASSDHCSGLRSPPFRISMEPCPPRELVVNTSCGDSGALVSWRPSPVAEDYLVTARASDGHMPTCNTSFSNCSLSDLHCGQQYMLSVTASHQNCSSRASQNVTFNTVICQPDVLSVSIHCVNQSAVLSWTPVGDVVGYSASAENEAGHMLFCNSSSEPTCTMGGLQCGSQYNFSVQASDGTCNRSISEPVLAGGVPCPPEDLQVQLLPMESAVQTLHFEWSQVACPDVQYQLILTGSILGDSQAQFELSSYWTNSTFFEMPLPCGSSYLAMVQGRGPAGTSAPSEALNGTTAPCSPANVTFRGSTASAVLSWYDSVFATYYTVYDNRTAPPSQLCNLTELTCSLTEVPHGSVLITASNAAGESDSAPVERVIGGGRSRRDLRDNNKAALSVPIVSVIVEGSTVLVVKWPPVRGVDFYSLVISQQNNTQTLRVDGEKTMLTDLSPDSTYCLSVRAESSSTVGSYSKPQCVQTA
ncbi:uncharacterized protein LOC115548942 isoform X4 [Gadus morhua]|uniref:uncharacterized protein LOC115548942 isoform X4 n=1 Tax=Gadus morhua TaxID=8049 RepID=UPI0011B6B9D6|nr:uncharacterized protein LOC115548942 isoform X4 [Gadus morhua]